MKSDMDFGVAEVVRGSEIVDLCRHAVLYSLTTREPDEPMLAYYLRAVAKHRARLYALSNAGWATVAKGDFKTLSYLRNCQPIGLRMPSSFRLTYCNRPRICPWCYARKRLIETAAIADAAVRMVVACCDKPDEARQKLQLSILVSVWRYPAGTELSSLMAEEKEKLLFDRNRYADEPGFFGASSRSVVTPRKDDPGHNLATCTLLLHHKDIEVCGSPSASTGKVTRVTELTKTGILSALCNQAPFPSAFFNAPVDRLVPILNCYTKRQRSTTATGIFSNSEVLRAAARLEKQPKEEEAVEVATGEE